MDKIEDLGFVKMRLPLLEPQQDSAIKVRRSADRTTALVRRWVELRDRLKSARVDTLFFCEARPGKGDAVNLVVADREGFDTAQEQIASLSEDFEKAESAIRELAAGGFGWYDEILSQIQIHGQTEDFEKRRLNQIVAAAMMRYNTMAPDDVLKLDEVKANREDSEATIEASRKRLEELRPRLQELEGILASCGC